VTQPRVTCYRVGIRMDEPQMAALLTSSGRPGFYLRVIEEGEVGAGDAMVKVSEERERLTIAEANALLYLPGRTRAQLERALRVPALPAGWRSSFQALLDSEVSHPNAQGNAGLAPGAARQAAPGFFPLRVSRMDRESADVISLSLLPAGDRKLTAPLPGQFVVLRLQPEPGRPALYRSYSLSGPPSSDLYRVSVKREANGAAGAYLHGHVQVGDVLDVSTPRGGFVLGSGERPVVLLSAGIGVTPVLAMLYSLALASSARETWWLHGARNGKGHSFASDSRDLLRALPRGRGYVLYSRPDPDDRSGRDFDAVGHLGMATIDALGVPRDADFYICGPSKFMGDLSAGLAASGVASNRIHMEAFSGGESMTPGIATAARRPAHAPKGSEGTGPLVSFARSGLAVRWRPDGYASLLELAEACDVPVRWACRTGVCHSCESGLVSGSVAYSPDPLDPPGDGNLLICCSRPAGDVVIDI